MTEARLTIGIPVYQGCQDLRECLSSIYRHLDSVEVGGFKVVVCDDGSTDGTAEMVQQEFPLVKLLVNPENCGVSYSSNLILQEMVGDYYLRLDADTKVLRGSVKKLLKFMKSKPECGVVAAGLIGPGGKRQKNIEARLQTPAFWFWQYLIWPRKLLEKAAVRLGLGWQSQTRQVEAMASAAILVRSGAIEQVGGLDEKLPFFMEDADWVMRIKRAGWQLWYYPQARIYHRGGQSAGSEDLYILCRDRCLQSLCRFTQKHFPGQFNQFILTSSVLLGSGISLVLAVLAWLPARLNPGAKKIVNRGLRSFLNVFTWHLFRT